MLLPVSRPTDKFAPLAGLRSLLVPDTVTAGGGGGGVVTRTILASSPCGACGESGIVHQESVDDDEEDEWCWVSYGRRDPGRRRLPPPIPSLAARSALRRARTDDRRIVISKVRVMRPDYYVRARRVRGGRLLMRLVEREDDDGPLPAPSAREDDDVTRLDSTATSAVVAEAAAAPATLPPSPLPAVGCFEDVARCQYAVGSRPLHQAPLLRMVH